MASIPCFSELLNRILQSRAIQSVFLRPVTSISPDEFARNANLGPSLILLIPGNGEKESVLASFPSDS